MTIYYVYVAHDDIKKKSDENSRYTHKWALPTFFYDIIINPKGIPVMMLVYEITK
jgi:hypothetical protein